MLIVLTIVHVLIAILLIVGVLLQKGKGGGLAASVGGGLSSGSVLGGRAAATFLTKTTSVLATAFLLSCLVQSFMWSSSGEQPMTATERMLQEGGIPQQLPGFEETVGDLENPSVLGGVVEDDAERVGQGVPD